MGQQGLPQLGALLEDGVELLWRELQDDLEGLGLGALAAFDEALPHFGVLPHLGGQRGMVKSGAFSLCPPLHTHTWAQGAVNSASPPCVSRSHWGWRSPPRGSAESQGSWWRSEGVRCTWSGAEAWHCHMHLRSPRPRGSRAEK